MYSNDSIDSAVAFHCKMIFTMTTSGTQSEFIYCSLARRKMILPSPV